MPSTSPSPFTTRTMTRVEIDTAVDWAATEGWNPGLHDAAAFHAADPGGFLVGLLGDRPVAVLSAVKYGTGFGFMGFYIVHPCFRGQGYGLRLWNDGLARLQGRTIGLDGVLAQQANYQKCGFVLAHRNIRHAGAGGGTAPRDPRLVHLSELPFEAVLDYDRPFFPDDRRAFLEPWIRPPGGAALGLVGPSGTLAGYGVVRPCRNGSKIGPLFADTPAAAETLFAALRCRVPEGTALFLDLPETNPHARALARRHRLAPVFETVRMYRGPSPGPMTDRIFGITSFELG